MKFYTRQFLLIFVVMCVYFLLFCRELFPDEGYFSPRSEATHLIDSHLLITPPDCSGEDLLVFVLSVAESSGRRNAVRRTWGSVARTGRWPSAQHKFSVKVIFLFGSYDARIQETLQEEASVHQDILQINSPESYEVSSDKILLALKWMTTKCSKAKYVLKADDDVFVNIPTVLERLVSSDGAILFGDVIPLPVAHRFGKHQVSFSEYPYFFYPPYVIGYCYFMSSEVAMTLFEASSHVPYLKFEDVFIGGILTRATNVQLVQLYPSWLSVEKKFHLCDFRTRYLFAAADLSVQSMMDIWETFLDNSKCRAFIDT